MKYLIIILLLCSCSSKLLVNGVEVKTKNTIPKREAPVLIGAFLVGFTLTPMFVKP